MALANLKIGFIGAGQMASAMIKGWLSKDILPATHMYTINRSSESKQQMLDLGVNAMSAADGHSNADLAAACDVIFLAVKPQVMAQMLKTLAPHVSPERHTLVTIAAGLPLSLYQEILPPGTRLVRVMPNTPLLVGKGACAYCLGEHASGEDEEVVKVLLAACGMVVQVEEKMMDAVTAVSGSSPAYIYTVIEAMADGGVLAGLPRATALKLAAQSVMGAAAMVLEAAGDGSTTHPGVLKDQVTSPAGTTIEALRVLEQRGVRGAFIDAVAACAERSKQLSKQ